MGLVVVFDGGLGDCNDVFGVCKEFWFVFCCEGSVGVGGGGVVFGDGVVFVGVVYVVGDGGEDWCFLYGC